MIDVILGFVYSFAAVLFFAFLFHSPRRTLAITSLIAAFGYSSYCALKLFLGFGELGAVFVGTLIVTLGCEISARAIKAPVTVMLYPAILPFVPGLLLYRSMYYMVTGDFSQFVRAGVDTILIACTMAAAVAIVTTFMKSQVRK